jgi:hypothetical protein
MDLNSLSEGLSQLINYGKVEISFTIQGINVILRSLSSDEEIRISHKMNGIESDGIEYLQTYKLLMLAYSIVQLNTIDLRDIVSLPRKDKSGKIENILKEDYVFDIIKTWARSSLNVCFKKYGELLAISEREAEKGIEFEIIDKKSEISRLQAKIDELKGDSSEPEHPAETIFEEEKKEAEDKLSES